MTQDPSKFKPAYPLQDPSLLGGFTGTDEFQTARLFDFLNLISLLSMQETRAMVERVFARMAD